MNLKIRQVSHHYKRVIEAAKLAYANKKEYITSQKFGSQDFWLIANSALIKCKSAIPSLFNSTNVLSSASDRAKLFAKNVSKNFNLDGLDIFLPVSPSRTNLKLDNTYVTIKMVVKIKTNLDSSKVPNPDCIPKVYTLTLICVGGFTLPPCWFSRNNSEMVTAVTLAFCSIE